MTRLDDRRCVCGTDFDGQSRGCPVCGRVWPENLVEGRVGPWTRLPCEECGIEHQATRTMPSDGPFICEACESRQKGYTDGRRDGLREAVEAVKRRILAARAKSAFFEASALAEACGELRELVKKAED